jgi:ketosteroid isomerase-like protein
MSQENIELTRSAIEAFRASEIEAFIAYCDPSIEVHSVFAAVGGGVYHGHDGVRRWHRDLEEAWGERFRAEPETYFDLGDETLLFFVLHGRGEHSDVEVAMPSAGVARWRDGRMIYYGAYVHREAALSDLGVLEEHLEPIDP